MARVKTIEDRYVDEAGEARVLRTAVEVDSHGRFSATVPDWLEANLRIASTRSTPVTRPRTHLRIECDSLAPIEALLARALGDYSAPVVSETVAIRCAVGTKAAGWRMDDGRIVPNGQVAAAIGREEGLERGPSGRWGDWIAGLKVGDFVHDAVVGYQVVVGARVVRRVESRRGAAVTVEYGTFDGEGLPDPAPVREINGYMHLDLSPGRGHRGAEVREMAYTHEAGVFFARMMAAVTTLAAGLQAFFADAATLPGRIAAGATPLSLPAPAPTTDRAGSAPGRDVSGTTGERAT